MNTRAVKVYLEAALMIYERHCRCSCVAVSNAPSSSNRNQTRAALVKAYAMRFSPRDDRPVWISDFEGDRGRPVIDEVRLHRVTALCLAAAMSRRGDL